LSEIISSLKINSLSGKYFKITSTSSFVFLFFLEEIGMSSKTSSTLATFTSASGILSLGIISILESATIKGTSLVATDFKRAKSRALWYLSRGDLSEKGLAEKLKTAGFGEKAAQATVERMAELGLIDDEKYARRLLESLTMSGASEKEIYFKLKNKGISSDIAKEVLSESETDESEKIKGLLYTKYQNKLETQEGVQKVIASLARKGFSFSDIKDALRAYNEEIICEEDI
jgi:regulatory protein